MEPKFTLLLAFYIGGIFLMLDAICEWVAKWKGGKYSKNAVRFALGIVITGGAIYSMWAFGLLK